MEIQLLQNNDIDRYQWDELIHKSPQGSIYALSGFLDITHPNWAGIIAIEDQEMIALLPVFPKQKWGISYTYQPRFGQHQGIIFGDLGRDQKTRELKKKRKIVLAFVDILQKKFKLFSQYFSPHFDYPLPFHWKGYSLYTRYTYQLNLPGDDKALFNHFSSNHLRQIRKAIKRGYKVRSQPFIDDCLDVIHGSMANKKDFLSKENRKKRKNILNWGIDQENGFLLILEKDGEAACAGFFLKFHSTIYYFFGGAYKPAKQSGAMYLMLSEAMKKCNQNGQVFDFEGSMIEPIEMFFLGFGPKPTPYLHIYKNQLPLRILWKMLGY